MKVNTIEQYKILNYIEDNFKMDFIYKDGNVVYN